MAAPPVILQDVRIPNTGSTTTTTYLYGLGLIAETDNAGTTHFYLGDGPGSTTQLVESDGDVANTYTYDVWGALRSSTGTTANQFDFTGEQADHKKARPSPASAGLAPTAPPPYTQKRNKRTVHFRKGGALSKD